jgi:AcrR family transcriptional regulator
MCRFQFNAASSRIRDVSSLRQLQRKKREQAILDAAATLFAERGYSAVNVEEIATRASAGVATVYKYFGSKTGLIRELFRPEIEHLRAAGERVLANPDPDPAQGMARLIAQYRFGERWQHRDLYREIASHNWGYAEVFTGLRERIDDLVRSQIEKLTRHYVRLDRMPRSVRPQDVSFILYAVHTFHLQEWALHDDISLTVTRRAIRRHVLTAFRAWSLPPR